MRHLCFSAGMLEVRRLNAQPRKELLGVPVVAFGKDMQILTSFLHGSKGELGVLSKYELDRLKRSMEKKL